MNHCQNCDFPLDNDDEGETIACPVCLMENENENFLKKELESYAVVTHNPINPTCVGENKQPKKAKK